MSAALENVERWAHRWVRSPQWRGLWLFMVITGTHEFVRAWTSDSSFRFARAQILLAIYCIVFAQAWSKERA